MATYRIWRTDTEEDVADGVDLVASTEQRAVDAWVAAQRSAGVRDYDKGGVQLALSVKESGATVERTVTFLAPAPVAVIT